MKDVLEQLKDNVLKAADIRGHGRVRRILDTFISEWEVVEVCENKHCKGLWYFEEDDGFDPHHRKHIQTVLRRTQEPTLLEAVGEARDIVGSVLEVERGRAAQASVRLLESAYDALATAISKEQSE